MHPVRSIGVVYPKKKKKKKKKKNFKEKATIENSPTTVLILRVDLLFKLPKT